DGASRGPDHLCGRPALRPAFHYDCTLGLRSDRGSAAGRLDHVGTCRRTLSHCGARPPCALVRARERQGRCRVIGKLRAWARRHTEQDRYSPVGIAFHWVMAFLVLFQLGWGWWTGFLHPGGDKLQAYQIHAAVGLPILVLALGRVAWRLLIPGPVNDADKGGWQTQAAYLTHYLFYLCFFALPLSGWVMWSSVAEPGPLYLAGVVPWPR